MKKPRQARAVTEAVPRQSLPLRQRQRLIDACITALHLYGPTGATVARVVAIAKLSPGIVRFYFQSKAAMLVASLQFLATEFEERVVTPVVALRDQPALALQRLVELYLDADIASPRKVAVWYAFWGEASARQEYLAICGQKDANFAAVVHDLIDRMIALSGRRHLDSEAVALGLIGVLEMQWQGFAFEEEVNIDRALARRRCMAYLRSVFPREFSALTPAWERRSVGCTAPPTTNSTASSVAPGSSPATSMTCPAAATLLRSTSPGPACSSCGMRQARCEHFATPAAASHTRWSRRAAGAWPKVASPAPCMDSATGSMVAQCRRAKGRCCWSSRCIVLAG